MSSVRFLVFALLFPIALTANAQELQRVATFEPLPEHGAFVVRSVDGGMACTDATRTEALQINARPRVPLRVFGEEPWRIRTHASAGLNIILRGTAQLDANPTAKAAFERAAEIWESQIATPITVFFDVDFGTTRFGEPYGEGILGSAGTDDRGGESGFYEGVRAALVARGHNANETALYNALPNGSLPTDLGPTTGIASPSMLFRALGLLGANPPGDENAPSIGFNSAFAYDFDPSNGISPEQIDFEGLVLHEIGHILGFTSRAGSQEIGETINAPSVFDLFRFRPDVTLGTFGAANRIQSSGGTQVYFTGFGALQLSTGRPDGTGGDERQASHWKDDDLLGPRIGVMDPTLAEGIRYELTDEDLQAFGMMGYDIAGSQSPAAPAAPSNLTAAGTSTSVIRLNWTDNSNNETSFRIEQLIGSSFVDIGGAAIDATQINVTGFSAGQSITFRIRARNAAGDSAYSNEATGTTNSDPGTCTQSATVVCLLDNRFQVQIDYVNPFSNPPNQPGTFLAARLLEGVQNPDTALFGFSSANAVEVLVRLQDTRPFAPRFDVYYGGMTDVGYTVFVTDTQTGVSRQYSNQVGQVGGGVDRSSFPASALGSPDRLMTSGGRDSFPAEPDPIPQPGDLRAATAMHSLTVTGDSPYSNEATGTTQSTSGAPCTPTTTVVCLLDNRFQVEIDYVNPFSNPPNQPGTFLAGRLLEGTQNPDTALFGFSSAQAVEVVVRVQDTRPFAPRFDIYYGGMTDVGYTVSVTDTQTGTTRQYTNTVGTVGGGVDRTSFPAN